MNWWLLPKVGPIMERGQVNEVAVGLGEKPLLLGCRELLRHGWLLVLQEWEHGEGLVRWWQQRW